MHMLVRGDMPPERMRRMNQAVFRGSGTALVTPFVGEQVDFEALGRLIDRQIAGGTDALIVCGTTGEPPTLTTAEKTAVLGYALERVSDRIPVIAGTGTNSTKASVDQSIRAQRLGASGILAVTPYYNKSTQQGLYEHFTAIADAVQIPVILYNVPSRTGVNLLPGTAARLSEHENICGVKEASGDISQMAELARLTGDKLALYSGNDDQVLPMLALGGQGVISVAANVLPGHMHELVESWFMGDVRRCRTLQLQILPLVKALFSEVNPIPVKAALQMMGLCSGHMRLPLTELSEGNRQRLETLLRKFGAIE